MTDVLLRMLCGVTLGLALVLLLRRPARRIFGAGPAFTLWLLPITFAFAPLLPQELAPVSMVVLPGLTVTPNIGAASSSPAVGIDWPKWLTVVWLMGAAAGLLRLGIHYIRLLRGLRKPPAAWATMLDKDAPDLDVRRVRAHDAGPAVLWAFPRSWILLPADFANRFCNEATRELVLRHELTHARRGDALWSLVMEIVSALLWFHPLVWLARPRFRLDQELACDAASLRALPARNANYARALLESVAVQPAPALIPWLAEPQLKERIAMITRMPPGAFRRRAGFVVIAMLVAVGVYVAGGQMPADAAAQISRPSGAPSPDLAVAVHNGNLLMAASETPQILSRDDDGKSTPPSVYVTYKNRNPPHYPVEALHKGEQGEVLLVITVDATGKVMDVAVDPKRTTAPAILQTAAAQAANHWRFNPGMKDGHPVGGRIEVPVTFSLNPSWTSPHAQTCPPGFRYRKGNGKSYSCIAPSSAQASS